MKYLDFCEPKRYSFDVEYHEWDIVTVKKVENPIGQFVSYEQYEALLSALDDAEMELLVIGEV